MTWKHVNKEGAFNYLPLNRELAKTHNLTCHRDVLRTSKISLSDQAAKMLSTLNDFDQEKILDEILYISKHPDSTSSIKHSFIPFKRLHRSKTPFKSYHYLIEYEKVGNKINIFDVYFDEDLHGSKLKDRNERNMMYQVNRLAGTSKFNGAWSEEGLKKPKASWAIKGPTHEIITEHVAVNGMQNNLKKATWLMGTHLDVAFPNDDVNDYTLFHNPTDGIGYDVVECMFDKRSGIKSENARHLAAVLNQRQKQGKETKWVVHSQGAIIFSAALEEYHRVYSGWLSQHSVVLHAPGISIDRLNHWAVRTGVTVIRENSNPFDPVPNLAGQNDLSSSGLINSLKFLGLTLNGSLTSSCHTLPYLGLESYHAQLRFAGEHRRAQDVLNYIEKNT
jgi:hypothetical protein